MGTRTALWFAFFKTGDGGCLAEDVNKTGLPPLVGKSRKEIVANVAKVFPGPHDDFRYVRVEIKKPWPPRRKPAKRGGRSHER